MFICGSNCLIIAIFSLVPVLPHFIWPLSNCLLADLCNHTRTPECGEEISSKGVDYRHFIDECDMYEVNCDHNRSYKMVNYSACFLPVTGCSTRKSLRIENYTYYLEGRKVIYDPIERPTLVSTTPHFKSSQKKLTPKLPVHMFKGKRRYTPEVRRLMKKKLTKKRARKAQTTKLAKIPTKRKPTTTRNVKENTESEMYVIKKEIVVKNGKKLIRVVKGYRDPLKTMSSGFIE